MAEWTRVVGGHTQSKNLISFKANFIKLAARLEKLPRLNHFAFPLPTTSSSSNVNADFFPALISHCYVIGTFQFHIAQSSYFGRSTTTMRSFYKQAQSCIPATISLPPPWIRSYQEFVSKNASQVSQIESALRSLSYIIPGVPCRLSQLFRNSETDAL